MSFLKKYLQKRAKAVKVLLKTPQKKWKVETFHQLRVEIKKLRALLGLIKFCNEDFKAKNTFLPFKLIFKQAGIIREFQLHKRVIKKHFDNTFFKDYQENTNLLIEKAEKDFFVLINKKNIVKIKKKYKTIFAALHFVRKKKSNIFVSKKKNFIQKILSASPLQIAIAHDLRKQIKTLNYAMECLGLEKSNAMSNQLASLLGKWHDNEVFIAFLQKDISYSFLGQKNLPQIQEIIKKALTDNMLLFDNINQWIKKHPNSVLT